jgi:hypothetical protein
MPASDPFRPWMALADRAPRDVSSTIIGRLAPAREASGTWGARLLTNRCPRI